MKKRKVILILFCCGAVFGVLSMLRFSMQEKGHTPAKRSNASPVCHGEHVAEPEHAWAYMTRQTLAGKPPVEDFSRSATLIALSC